MTSVHRRSVTASFATHAEALAAARLIRDKDLGEARIRAAGDSYHRDDIDGGLLSANNLSPLSSTAYWFTDAAPDTPEAPVASLPWHHRSEDARVRLTVVAAEADVPAVVALVRRAGGSV